MTKSNTDIPILEDDAITQHVAAMQAQLDECARSGRAYRVKWREVKLIITIIKTLQERLAQANDFNNDVVEREAAVCPEDVGFDEYIRVLERKLREQAHA